MTLGFKTVILGGSIVGVLTLENKDGLKGKLKTSIGGDDVFLALLDPETLVLITSKDFSAFSLPALDANNLNAYIIRGDRILSHGKTAALRPSDATVLDKIRSYRYERSTSKKIDKNIPQSLPDSSPTQPAVEKKPVTDYFLDILRYDDDAIAEVNYYENKPFSYPISPLPDDSAAVEAAAVGQVANKTDNSRKESAVFIYPDDYTLILPSAYARSFLSRDFSLKTSSPTQKIEASSRKTLSRGLKKRGKPITLETEKQPPRLREEPPKGIRIEQKQELNAKPPHPEPVPTIEADFFEEVAAQIDALMKTYPHEENLEKIIPDSRFALIPLAEGGSYVIGTVSSLYIIYGVPGIRTAPPAELKDAAFILVDEETQKGYWVLFQDARTGEGVKPAL